ncbi:MAG: GGDEF domain-containing protein [Thermoanaerobaculia bacterium]|jgi:diguanylate cyclase (GGDEF)-like protein|nr:GGDEF domain-containing protein [Thermoanaerobaculia bacterium]
MTPSPPEEDRAERGARLLSELAATSPELVLLATDPEGRVAWHGTSALRELGRTPDAVLGRPLAELLAERQVESLPPFRSDASCRSGPRLLNLVAADGSVVTVRALLESGPDGLLVAGVRLAAEEARLGEELLRLTNELATANREAVRRGRELERALERLRAANEVIERLARTDPLTHLVNRRGLEEAIAHERDRAERTGEPLSVVALDLDRFKRVNDTWGHAVGDRLLAAVGEALRAGVRPYDVAARLGGEEFLLVLPATRRERAADVAERLRARVADLVVEGLPERVTSSAGVAEHARGETTEALLARADAALYEAKRQGRDQVVVAPPPEPAG